MDYYHQPVQVTSQASPFMSYEQQSDPSFEEWKEHQDQQQVASVSVSSSTGLEDAMWGLSLQSPSDQEMSPGPYPERPGEQDCPYYMRTGLCAFGMSCRFNHPPNRKLAAAIARGKGEYPERPGQPECQYFLKTGTCKFGSTCKFDHPRDKAGIQSRVQLNIIGLPYRPGEKECAYYMRTGSCKYGVTCKFHHPQPALFASSPTAAAPGGSSAASPSQQSWPIRPFPSPRLQAGASSYTPLLLPSPQGVVSIPGWSAYHEGPHQPPALYIPGSPSAAELGYLPGSPTMGLPTLQPQQKEQTLPERPGATECQYYLKTGECKFGSNCRYHHPRDRAPSSPATLLSPMGLPLRPGVQACSYYVRFGICKFGPTCKFDHPIAAIYGFGAVEYPPPTPPRATLVELGSEEQGVSSGSSASGISSSSVGASGAGESSGVTPVTSTATVLLTRKGSSEESGSGAG